MGGEETGSSHDSPDPLHVPMIRAETLDKKGLLVIQSNTIVPEEDSMKKQGVVTFKVDDALFEIIRDMPNRSEFIRNALLEALGNICPLCNGTGILTTNQRQHWEEFCADHAVETCSECSERRLVCMSRG